MRIPYTMLALLLACLSLGTTAPPATNQQPLGRQAADVPAAPSIAGYYTVQGQIVGAEKPYTGIVSITQDRKAYVVRWLLDDGGVAVGVGLLDGNVLSVGSAAGAGRATAARYEVQQGSGKVKLVGKWVSVPGSGQVHDETLTWLRALAQGE